MKQNSPTASGRSILAVLLILGGGGTVLFGIFLLGPGLYLLALGQGGGNVGGWFMALMGLFLTVAGVRAFKRGRRTYEAGASQR